MLFNGRTLIFTFSQVRIAEIERLQSLFKMSMGQLHRYAYDYAYDYNYSAREIIDYNYDKCCL